MAKICPRPTLEEVCHNPCVTTWDLKGASRSGDHDPASLSGSCFQRAVLRKKPEKEFSGPNPCLQGMLGCLESTATTCSYAPIRSILRVTHCTQSSSNISTPSEKLPLINKFLRLCKRIVGGLTGVTRGSSECEPGFCCLRPL